MVAAKKWINYIYIKIENKCLNANNNSQYYCFYCISGNIRDFFQNIIEFYQPKLLKIYTVMQKSHLHLWYFCYLFLTLHSQFIVIELLGKLIMVIAGIIWTRFSWTSVAKSIYQYLFYHQHSFLKVHSNYYTNNKPTHPHINQTLTQRNMYASTQAHTSHSHMHEYHSITVLIHLTHTNAGLMEMDEDEKSHWPSLLYVNLNVYAAPLRTTMKNWITSLQFRVQPYSDFLWIIKHICLILRTERQ